MPFAYSSILLIKSQLLQLVQGQAQFRWNLFSTTLLTFLNVPAFFLFRLFDLQLTLVWGILGRLVFRRCRGRCCRRRRRRRRRRCCRRRWMLQIPAIVGSNVDGYNTIPVRTRNIEAEMKPIKKLLEFFLDVEKTIRQMASLLTHSRLNWWLWFESKAATFFNRLCANAGTFTAVL